MPVKGWGKGTNVYVVSKYLDFSVFGLFKNFQPGAETSPQKTCFVARTTDTALKVQHAILARSSSRIDSRRTNECGFMSTVKSTGLPGEV
jgi:hypothetical protein